MLNANELSVGITELHILDEGIKMRNLQQWFILYD